MRRGPTYLIIGSVVLLAGCVSPTVIEPNRVSISSSLDSAPGSAPTAPASPGSGNATPIEISDGSVPAIPEFAAWESNMIQGGNRFCDRNQINAAIGSSGVTTEGNVWYYDGTKVYQQISRYTGDEFWNTCAGYVRDAYRSWVLAMTEGVSWPVGRLGGWRVFPHGLLNDFKQNGDALSRETVVRMAKYSAFAGNGGSSDCAASRETAYIINAYLAAEEAGETRSPQLGTAINNALGHLNGWFVTRNCTYMQPFMVGLTMEALIYAYEKTGDARIPPAIELAADGLWSRAWVEQDRAFWYESTATSSGTADLNLLIAPAYAWLWQRTGTVRHQERGDQIFAGGVIGAGYWSGKQFSQNYRSSFNYVKWRSKPPGTIVPLTPY